MGRGHRHASTATEENVQLIFTKGAGKHDQLDVCREGLQTERIDCPKQGIIPHDMVHYAVESVLHKRGFVGRLLDGEAASFRMVADSESDAVERLVEVFQADGWAGWNTPPDDLLDMYRVTCHARQCPPLAVDPEDIELVRQKLLQLTQQWQAIAVGEALTLPSAGANAAE